jgi:hypothetical protein
MADGNGSSSTTTPMAPGSAAWGRNGSIKRTLAPIEYMTSQREGPARSGATDCPTRPQSILTHPLGWAAATESVYLTRCCRDSSTAEHQLRLLKTGVRLLHSAPARRKANGPLVQHIQLML